MTTMKYLSAYPEPLVSRVRRVMDEGRLAPLLARRYPVAHAVRTNAALYAYVAGLFRDLPSEFLRMIAVHELAHLKEREHDRAFYQLCAHMEPDYGQYEFDLRAYLCHLEAGGEALWPASRSGHAGTADAGRSRGAPPLRARTDEWCET